MQFSTLALLLLAAVVPVLKADSPPSPVELYYTPLYSDPHLVSYYRFEGDATDAKGSNNGTASNVTYGASYGRFGQGSRYTSAALSYINAGASTDFQLTGDFSINVWVNLLSCANPAGTKMIAKWNESGNNRSYGLSLGAGCQPYSNISPDGMNVGPYYTFPPNGISTNTWHMVTFVRSGGVQYIYVDGTVVASGQATNPYNSGVNSHLMIGGDGGENWAGVNSSLDAYLDDASIFNRAISATEISKLYTGNWQNTGTITVSATQQNNQPLTGAPFTLMKDGVFFTSGSTPFTTSTALAGTYTITFNPVAGYIAPTAPPQTLTAGGVIAFSGQYIPVVPPPSINSISPTSGFLGQNIVNFTLNGANFVPPLNSGAFVSFATSGTPGNSGITVNSYSVTAGTQIMASISIAPDAVFGPRDVIVTNRDGQQAKLAVAFQVKPRPVIIIPGTLGSTLRRVDNNALIWLNLPDPAVAELNCDLFVLPLALNKDGITPADPFPFTWCGPLFSQTLQGTSAVATELLGQNAVSPFYKLDFYNNLLASLTAASFPVYTFPYDWRADFNANAQLLRTYIRDLTPNPGDTVDIIAHSQGGLVARTYYESFKSDHRMNTIIYLGTPHLGTPKTYGAVNGKFGCELSDLPPISLNLQTCGFVSQNWPAFYELMPRYDFMCSSPLWCLNNAGVFEAFSTTYGLTAIQPINGSLPNAHLAQQAETLWSTTLDNGFIPVRTFAINGSGHNTIQTLAKDPSRGCLVTLSDPTGDGTVPNNSAAAVGGASIFYVNEEHVKLPNNSIVDQSIINILHGVAPTAISGSLQIVPFTSPSLSIIGNTCSPVTIQLFDTTGHMSGVDGNGALHEDINNSLFARFATNESFVLPAQGAYTASLQATDNGTFSLFFNIVNSQNSVISAFDFSDVPISRNSKAQVVFDPAAATQSMMLDVNGDGTVLYTIQTNHPVPVAAFVSALVNVVQVFTLPKGLETDLTSVLLAALDSLQRGNTGAARNQLGAFENKVAAETGKGLTTAQASTLVNLANKAITLL